MIKAVKILSLLAIGLILNPVGLVYADEIEAPKPPEKTTTSTDTGTDIHVPDSSFEIITETYTVVENWDGTGIPIDTDGSEVKNGWVKIGEDYFKFENEVMVEKNKVFPTNFNGKNGSSNIHIKILVETGFNKPLGVWLKSPEEGVESKVLLNDLNGYEAYLEEVPAGNYFISTIYYADSDLKLPIADKQFIFEDEFTVKKDITSVQKIGTKEYYEEIGDESKLAIIDKNDENRENQEADEVDEVVIVEEVIEEKKSNKLLFNLIILAFIGGLGVLGYKAYNHVK